MSAENSPGGYDRGQILLIVLVALALIASLIMLFTNSDGALKIALLAALWAAIIGFFLVTRYRRQAERSQEEMEHREDLHRAEMEKAAAERRSEQRGREVELRDKQLARDTEVLEEIKQELAALRAQLEELNGREFGYEPAALRAEARRIQELEARTSAARAGFDAGDLVDLDDDSDRDAAATGSDARGKPLRPHVSGAPSAEAISGRLGQYEPSRPQVNPLTNLISESYRQERQGEEAPATGKGPRRIFDTGSFQTVPWDQGGAEDAKSKGAAGQDDKKSAEDEKPAEPKNGKKQDKKSEKKADKPDQSEKKAGKTPGKPAEPAAESAAEPQKKGQADEGGQADKTEKPATATPVTDAPVEDDEPRRGRRRRDEHTEGISVAELMANLKKKEN
ncbi:DUF6779 domain-containing protein [Corynebacterium halotolerans]|uniref:Zinc metalloprotease n=1 Tax=Corynebacterium halotolerans YIM 70093 = DSM 44683 TaxID=1121362 RepID=M1N0F5_9CORY|nr:DUF6779 domain-containing protein [Corynebacterium halotolerans]AGF73444.1 Zinc metalloprotease [Corynebacterium halotolerans YIM 70093 = DSM 44683]